MNNIENKDRYLAVSVREYFVVKSRLGKSFDYPEQKREQIFETYHEYFGKVPMYSLAKKMGVRSSTSIYQVRSTNWFKEMCNERGVKIET